MNPFWIGLGCCWLVGMADDRVQPVDFNREVRPILADRCFACHGPDPKPRKAGLRLDTREGLLGPRGGKPAVVVPGRPESSELMRRLTYADLEQRMPPAESGKPLSETQLSVLRRWIEQGARWQQHWGYVPPSRPKLPALRDTSWPTGAIDCFILARLERERLAPSPEAEPHTLVRRLYFDLLGLPPTPAEVAAFVHDRTLDRYERLVDRLLHSPHFGERLAISWLDLVRYADTVGYHGDQEHFISPYRDYVIRAFNDNMPFDRFTIEQLAGDLLPAPTREQRVATGYNRVLQTSHEGGVQKKEYLAKYAADRVRNLSSVWLGATMGCAECHDHKYDPFTQRDFYSLAAFFADIDDNFRGTDTSPTNREPELELLTPDDRKRLPQLEAELARLSGSGQTAPAKSAAPGKAATRANTEPPELAALRQAIDAIHRNARRTMVTVAIAPRTMRVLHRGDWMDETGEVVQPAVPSVFAPISTSGRATRLDLARWLVSPEQPLTARVFVNRLWQSFFGKGISARLDDLGAQGEPPLHPELLDWLAIEFMERGWDVKHVVREIVQSRTYRQSSLAPLELRQRDPENRLLARQSRPRLPAELVRDNALAISGLLVRSIGGPSVRPYQPAGYYQHLNFPKRTYVADGGENQYRRGVYTHWQRSYLHPMLKAFDAPSREECTAERPVSNTPLAALVLLNDPTFVEAAEAFADRIVRCGGSTVDERIRWAWREAVAREPDPHELRVLRELVEREAAELRHNATGPTAAPGRTGPSTPGGPPTAQGRSVERATWLPIARVILNLDEFLTRY